MDRGVGSRVTLESASTARVPAWSTDRARRRGLLAIPAAALVTDAAAITGAVGAGVLLRDTLPVFGSPLIPATHAWSVLLPIMVLWVVVLTLTGAYRREIFGAGTDEYKRVAHAAALTAGAVGIGCYLLQAELSRGIYFFMFAVGAPLLAWGRYVLRTALKQARRRGLLRHRVLIAGTPAHIDEIAKVLSRETWLGYHVVGALTPEGDTAIRTPGGLQVRGTPRDVARACAAIGADTFFVTGGAFDGAAEMRKAVWDLEQQAVQVVVAPSVTDVASERVRIRPVGGLPLVHLDPPRSAAATRWAKRTFDVVGALALLVLFSPVLAIAAIRIHAHDRGPVIFRQLRAGRDGELFGCFKLRSMVVDAEQLLPELHSSAGHGGGLFKLPHDPRITRPGAWLRRFSLDELPQLVNVLRGHMSLVGPRPPLPIEVAAYTDEMHRRLRVRPGMTGLWQVSGRSDLSWDEAIRLDLYYVDNWSMLQDLVILARTFSAVARRRGAY
jgi:exopolysaccharide biosynthesis polyprenyl glycosylphosphotransferase